MSIVAWLIVGIIAGLIARAIVPGEVGGGLITDLVVGIVGAFIGGWLGSMFFGTHGVNGLNLHSIVVSVLGAVVLLFIVRLVSGRRLTTI